MTSCPPIVGELESSSGSLLERRRFCLPRQFFARSATNTRGSHWSPWQCRSWADGEEECPVQKLASEPGEKFHMSEITGLPLDPKLVADASKEELMFMRKLQVYHEIPVNYLDNSGLKAIGTRWVDTHKGCRESIHPSKAGCAENQESERVDTKGREQHVCSHASTGKSQGHAQSMHGWQAGERLLKRMFWDSTTSEERISTALHVIKVPREDDECTSGYAVLDKAMFGTKDAAQCFDVASENAMTAMGLDTVNFPTFLHHSTAVVMSVFRHGDDFVGVGHENTTKGVRGTIDQAAHRQASCHTWTHWETSRKSGY